jgi:subtilisin family serine protease
VITVGASTYTDKIAAYSLAECGAVLCVDVAAPGGGGSYRILSTNRGGGYGLIAGTSPAAAHVTGALALALELRRKITFDDLVRLMQRTARPLVCSACTPSRQGAGLIDVNAMVGELTK